MTESYLELCGALLIVERKGREAAVTSLLDGCRCLNGEFHASNGVELGSPSELLAYLFDHAEAEGYLDWSCDSGFVALEFDSDGSLIIIWSDQDITLASAINSVEEIADLVSADRGYVSLGGWLPGSHEEFLIGFTGDTLHQIIRNKSE